MAAKGEGELELESMSFTSVECGEDARFAAVVALLEEVVMGGKCREGELPLQDELEAWNRSHCKSFSVFGEGGEHPVLWMELFNEYTSLVESRLDAALSQLDPPCTYTELEGLLTEHCEELSGDVFDLLMSMGEYEEFVSTMQSYAAQLAWEETRGVGGGGMFSGLEPTVTQFKGDPQ